MPTSDRAWLAPLTAAALLLGTTTAHAFKEQGHRSIEAAAYRHLIDLGKQQVLITLIADGFLRGRVPAVRAEGLADNPAFLPVSEDEEQVEGVWLGSHLPDHSFEHQLESYGQCYHFMARAEDVYGSKGRIRGTPEKLVKDAYTRCMSLVDILIRGILFDPEGSRKRGSDLYTLIHIIEDSFSEAHVARNAPRNGLSEDDNWTIAYLKPWRLRAWWAYLKPGRDHFGDFASESHHGALVDERDYGYLNETDAACDAQKSDLVGIECLSARGRQAADAIAELLVLIAGHAGCHRGAGSDRRVCTGFETGWNDYKRKYLRHADPLVSATYSNSELKRGLATGDLIGPSNVLDRPPPANLGIGLATDFADSSESLWLIGDVFVTRDPLRQHEIGLLDLTSYSMQVRLPLETVDGQRPVGVAGEYGVRVPVDLLPGDIGDWAQLHLGVRVRVALLASSLSRQRTRFIAEAGLALFDLNLVLFQRVWIGFEGPRIMGRADTLGPDVWLPLSFSVNVGAAVNAM